MILARLLGIDAPRLKRRGSLAAAAATVAVMMATLAVGFAAFAAYIALARYYDPDVAALIMAGILFLIAVTALLVARQVLKRAQRELRSAVASSAAVAFVPTAASMAARHTRLAAVVGVASIGFWLARNALRR